MLPILQLGPFAIQVPGLALLLGLWVGLSLGEREARRLSLNPDAIYNLAFTGLVVGVLAARLSYVARYFGAYVLDPLGIFSLNPSTLIPLDGFLIGCLAAVIYGTRKRLRLRPTLEALAPALAVMGVALALAHLASGDAFGAPARLPWSIFLWDEYRHPSQVYELLAALGVLAAWRWVRLPAAGWSFLFVVALSAAVRVFLEAFRGDSLLLAGGLRAAQVWGLVIVAGALAMMNAWSREATI